SNPRTLAGLPDFENSTLSGVYRILLKIVRNYNQPKTQCLCGFMALYFLKTAQNQRIAKL
ncbi:MAG: hypothetical protein PHV32_11345, partial [Eubacteriales bacterium]|nr:hypothetical protein [Eubacteriales bacterium]